MTNKYYVFAFTRAPVSGFALLGEMLGAGNLF